MIERLGFGAESSNALVPKEDGPFVRYTDYQEEERITLTRVIERLSSLYTKTDDKLGPEEAAGVSMAKTVVEEMRQ